MSTTQIPLSDAEVQALQALSRSRGKTPEEILQEAVRQFLRQIQAEDRLAALRQARGLWRDRQDLPDFGELRQGWDR